MKTREDLVSFLLTVGECDLGEAERFAREEYEKKKAKTAFAMSLLIAIGTVGFLAWGILFA